MDGQLQRKLNTSNTDMTRALTVFQSLVDFAHKQNGLLVRPHPVLIGPKQLLHIFLCEQESQDSRFTVLLIIQRRPAT